MPRETSSGYCAQVCEWCAHPLQSVALGPLDKNCRQSSAPEYTKAWWSCSIIKYLTHVTCGCCNGQAHQETSNTLLVLLMRPSFSMCYQDVFLDAYKLLEACTPRDNINMCTYPEELDWDLLLYTGDGTQPADLAAVNATLQAMPPPP